MSDENNKVIYAINYCCLIILLNANVQKIVIQVVVMLFYFCIALVQVCSVLLRFTRVYIELLQLIFK